MTHTEHVAPVYQNLTTYHTVCNECKQVIDGKADDLPEQAFRYASTIEDVRERARKMGEK